MKQKKQKLKLFHASRFTLRDDRGSAIIFAILLMGVMLAITFALSAAFIPKIRQSSEAGRSVSAIYTADSGIEWCLYIYNKGATTAPSNAAGNVYSDGNGNSVDPTVYCPSPGPALRVLGTANGVSRALEVSF